MGYSLADLRRVFYRAEAGESVSDAEYRELEDAMEAGLDFRTIADMADQTSSESFNEIATPANRQWLYALQNRATTPARHLIIGDSYVELGAFSPVVSILTSYFNDFTPNAFTGSGTKWTNASTAFGTLTTTGAQNSAGPQNYSIQITGAQTIGAFTFGGTSCEFYFDPAAGGTVDIAIDGGAPTSFVTSSSNGKTTISGLSRAVQHTCIITNTAGTSRFWGYYPGLIKGTMQWYIAGHSGYDLSETMACTQNLVWMQQVNPHRITLEFGINDYGFGADEFRDNLETFVGQIRAVLPNVSIDLWIPPQTGTRTDWPSYARKLRSKCRELEISFFDGYAALGDVAGAEDVYNISSDDTHIGSPGTDVAAMAWAESLLPNPMAFSAGVATKTYALKVRSGPLVGSNRYSYPRELSRSTATPTLNRLYYIPIHLAGSSGFFGLTCTGMQAETTTGGGAGSVVRLGLYSNLESLGDIPSTLLFQSSTIASTGIGALTFTPSPTNLFLTPGLYWLAIVAQVATPTLRMVTLADHIASSAVIGSAQYTHVYEAGVTGALPASAGTLVDGTGATPLVAIKL